MSIIFVAPTTTILYSNILIITCDFHATKSESAPVRPLTKITTCPVGFFYVFDLRRDGCSVKKSKTSLSPLPFRSLLRWFASVVVLNAPATRPRPFLEASGFSRIFASLFSFLFIAGNIGFNFVFPKSFVALRPYKVFAALMTMPETTVNKNYGFIFR